MLRDVLSQYANPIVRLAEAMGGDVRAVATRGGSLLLVGGQERRLPVAAAMLEGQLVSTLITDLEFAWRILCQKLPWLTKTGDGG